MQTLSLVEGFAVSISTPFIGTEDLVRARHINDAMIDCLHHFDPVQFTRLNLEFHEVLFENCPNPHVLDLVQRGWARLRALRTSTFSFVPGRAQNSVVEHAALLDLIESGADQLEIELAARNHRLATLNAFLSHQNDSSPSPTVPEPTVPEALEGHFDRLNDRGRSVPEALEEHFDRLNDRATATTE